MDERRLTGRGRMLHRQRCCRVRVFNFILFLTWLLILRSCRFGMGTIFQLSQYLFTNLLNHNCDAALVYKFQDIWINIKNSFVKVFISIGCDHLRRSMDRVFEQNDKEYVRYTMQRQEEIFKQQVKELHRLYRVQKFLMTEVRTKDAAAKDTRSRHWSNTTSTSETSHSSYIINNQPLSIPHLNSRYKSLKEKGFDLEQPVKEETSISLDCSREGWADEECCDVDLTLSIGCGSGNKSKHWLQPGASPNNPKPQLLSTTPIRPERGEEHSNRESLQKPPWPFQATSMN